MIVACPSCQTRFKLDPAKLQPVGRHVRCAKCSHRWLQLPEGMEPPAGLMPAVSDEPAPGPAAESFESPAGGVPAAPEPEAAATEAPASDAAGAPAETSEGSPARPPETPAEMAESLAAIAEQVAAAGEAGTATRPALKPDTRGPALRLGMRMTGPITVPPQLRPVRPARRNSGMGLLLVAGVIIGLLAIAYIFRDVIARTIPGADAIYSMLRLSTDNPAADLEISIDKVDTQDDEGKRFFSVTATVFNLSQYPVDMPPLMIVPMDENNKQMEPILFRLRERVAEPGQNIKFQKSFDNWPANAKGFVLTVAGAP